ncbi:unnamed protein product [Leptosia nina]|uniref:Uncharacterized protein n=1 Tax=Leptosia nina TaxID=320188 RepID=A0AAV1K2E4_9NEOP
MAGSRQALVLRCTSLEAQQCRELADNGAFSRCVRAEDWRWPSAGREEARADSSETQSVVLDAKVAFVDPEGSLSLERGERNENVVRDEYESAFQPPGDSAGFYDRPPNARRFPVDSGGRDSGESESAQRGVLIGPKGPTGFVGPVYARPILVGPGGPTGIIGPRRQAVLVGPGGPTGIIGPRRQNVLIGPGGPTGIIGPRRQSVLVGPGGPMGTFGPRRQGLLVGPGGPTGIIGPF